MVKQFLKIAGVKTEKDFYKKYPPKQSFFKAHDDAEMLEMAMYGGAYMYGGDTSIPTMQMAGQMMQQPAPQQGGGGQEEQIIQFIAQALQQGADPQEILQQLVEAGIPQDQGTQLIQAVAEQMQQMMAQPQQGQQPMMRMGGKPCYGCGGKMAYGGPTKNNSTYSAGVSYASGGYVPLYADSAYNPAVMFEAGGSFDNPGFRALPEFVQQKIMSSSKKMVGGDLKVGGEYEMSEEEIKKLKKKGYKIQYL